MNSTEEHKIKVNFPFGQYFQQVFCTDIYVKFINPWSFWRKYRINHLETCLEIDIVKNLERCRQIKWHPARSQQHIKSIKKTTENGMYRGVPWEKTPQHTILITQPSMKLKYRGVTYLTSNIVAVKANTVATKPNLVNINPSEQNSTGKTDLTMPKFYPDKKRG